jgi:hypothetical protein
MLPSVIGRMGSSSVARLFTKSSHRDRFQEANQCSSVEFTTRDRLESIPTTVSAAPRWLGITPAPTAPTIPAPHFLMGNLPDGKFTLEIIAGDFAFRTGHRRIAIGLLAAPQIPRRPAAPLNTC